METIYPVVVTTIIGFNSGLCLCRLYDLLTKEKLELFCMYTYFPPKTNIAGSSVFGKLTCVPLNYILPGYRLESQIAWYKISHKCCSGRLNGMPDLKKIFRTFNMILKTLRHIDRLMFFGFLFIILNSTASILLKRDDRNLKRRMATHVLLLLLVDELIYVTVETISLNSARENPVNTLFSQLPSINSSISD